MECKDTVIEMEYIKQGNFKLSKSERDEKLMQFCHKPF